MLIIDTETTDLIKGGRLPLAQQPHIIEFAAVKLDDKSLVELDRMEFFANPGFPISPEAEKVSNISAAMLAKEKPFAAYYLPLVDFFLGERIVVAHNLPFDLKLLELELLRMDLLLHFPWPPRHICTAEITQDIQGKFLKLTELYQLATGHVLQQQHRAMSDVVALATVVRWLHKENRI